MRVLIADSFEPSGIFALRSAGCEISLQPGLSGVKLGPEVGRLQPDVLVVRSTEVSEAVMSAGPLKLVVRAGAGFNTIDVAAASRRGIYVCNCPGKNAIAVAELAFAHLLALDRRLTENTNALRQGRWDKTGFSQARGLFGRTLGLIGLGQIGREMIPRGHGFGMRVIAWSRSLSPEVAGELGVEMRTSPGETAADADVVSVHLALNPETRGLLGSEFFAALRPGAVFINTARAEIVDQQALLRAIRDKQIRAGLDVFAQEPTGATGEFQDPVGKAPGVSGTHHIGASTDQAQEAIAAETVRIILTFKATGKPPNAVNLARSTPATCALIVRHMDRPGVLAGVLDVISGERINVQEMENIVFEGAQAAVARIHLERAPEPAVLERIRMGNPDIVEIGLLRI